MTFLKKIVFLLKTFVFLKKKRYFQVKKMGKLLTNDRNRVII